MSEPTQSLTTTSTGSVNMISVIDRAARDPAVDVAKMERLLEMAERVHEREAKSQYDQAMNEAQGEMRPISRDCHNPHTRSRYASYEAIDSAIRPIYTKHGFAMSFGSKASSGGPDRVIVTCRVSHRGGHAEHVELEMPADGKGARGGDIQSRTHATGSALSYGKRYIANLVWNLSFGEEDDGNAAGGPRNARTTSRPVQPVKTPEKPSVAPKPATSEDVLPKKATEATRKWMLDELLRIWDERDLADFALGTNILGESDELTDWPLDKVPTSKQGLSLLSTEIGKWLGDKLPSGDTNQEFSEWFWDEIITVPRAKTKRADYMVQPDTIKSLYQAMKAGDENAKVRLWGLCREWEPKEWEGRDGKMHPPSKEDVKCREALDAFMQFEQQPDLIP